MIAPATRDAGPAHARTTAGSGAARALVLGFAALNVILLAWALRERDLSVRDGAGSVTTGVNVAFAIGVTLAVVLLLSLLPLPRSLRAAMQAFALIAQALHSLGHLARWYYLHRWFDDALHVALLMFASVLALRIAQAWEVLPPRHATPARAALVVLISSIALAGTWEIFEFTMDTVQGTREQDDLTDTMLDMIDGVAGGALGAAWAARRPKPRWPRSAGGSGRPRPAGQRTGGGLP